MHSLTHNIHINYSIVDYLEAILSEVNVVNEVVNDCAMPCRKGD